MQSDQTEAMPKEIAEAVTFVMGKVEYVQKKGTNNFHNYKFAAVGDILAKIQPAMVSAGLVIVQDEIAHELSPDGALMTATYAFTLAHKAGVEWGRKPRHTGMATAKNSKGGADDKALNKCHTAARKYFLLALFQIPTGDLPDPDEDDDKPHANGNGQTDAAKRPPPAKPSDEAKKWATAAEAAVRGCGTLTELRAWETKNDPALQKLSKLDTALFDGVMGTLADVYEKLTTATAGA